MAVDHLTRYVEASALTSEAAPEVVDFLLTNTILRHRAPRKLVSDRVTAFLSTLMHNMLQLGSSIHRPTTAYHTKINGMVERSNNMLAEMVSMYVQCGKSANNGAYATLLALWATSRVPHRCYASASSCIIPEFLLPMCCRQRRSQAMSSIRRPPDRNGLKCLKSCVAIGTIPSRWS